MMKLWAKAGLILLALCCKAQAAQPCEIVMFEDQNYSICTARAGDDLRLFLNGADDVPLGSFGAVNQVLADEQRQLAFAMNAGMYHANRKPVGLYIENRQETAGLVRRAGPGNFGLLPNGVFCVMDKGFAVIETLAFDAARPDCRFASQSGPMLVISGALHPKFLPDSDSHNVRNGVGVTADGGLAYFAISEKPVNFATFARLFRDHLGTPNALFLDGHISKLYAPSLGRNDFGLPMGPILGLAVPLP
jgi:prepilin-type processing-associated H-X9-DG protein